MNAVFFLLFSWGMVRARTRHQVLALALVGVTGAAIVAQPSITYAQGMIGAIENVLNLINGDIHTALNGINSVRSAMRNLYQTVAFPTQLINQARAQVTAMTNQFRNPMRSIFNISLTSATLPETQALESVMRNHETSDFSTLTSNYHSVFGLPISQTVASPQDRVMVDMDDALAKDNLKTLKDNRRCRANDALDGRPDRGWGEHGSARLGALSHRYRRRDEHPEPGPDPENDRGRTAPGGRAARALECPSEARDDLHQPIRGQHPEDAATPLSKRRTEKMKEKLGKLGQSARQSMARGSRWARAHKLRITVLAIVFALIAPRPAKTQFLDPCCAIMQAGLASISSALSHVIGGGLNSVLSTDQGIHSFQQTVVWPQASITHAQGLVGTLRGLFSQTESLIHTPVASATLPSTQQLETILLSRNANQIPNTTSSYTAVYGPVPGQTNAPPSVRNMIDMSDAVAQDAMKRAISIDNLADLELQAASQINQSIQTAAPGSAPIIEAQADAWLVRSNAYTQAALADLMRVQAVDLASAGAGVKMGATNASSLQQKIQQMLQPR